MGEDVTYIMYISSPLIGWDHTQPHLHGKQSYRSHTTWDEMWIIHGNIMQPQIWQAISLTVITTTAEWIFLGYGKLMYWNFLKQFKDINNEAIKVKKFIN